MRTIIGASVSVDVRKPARESEKVEKPALQNALTA
jgi:hypothetical protein